MDKRNIGGAAFDAFLATKYWIKFGDQAMELNDAFSAAKFYEKALVTDTADQVVLYKWAKSLMAYQNYEKALPICLEILENRKEDEFKMIHYDLGKLYKHLGQLEKSKVHYQLYLKEDVKSSYEHQFAKQELSVFEKVKKLRDDTLEVEVNNLAGTINTGASEFSPILLNDSVLLFSSLRAVSFLEDGSVEDLDYTSGIYKATKRDSLWLMSSELPASKSEQVSIANGSFIPGKNLFYFSVCSSFGSCKIHEGIIRNDSIVSHKALPSGINPELSSSTHPFVCSIKGKKTLVFSSNRSGGFGGMDLWVSVYNGQWSRAKNLGKKINTMGDELTPFYDQDSSLLYFSSNWHYNLGGLDVFSVKGSFPSKWGAIQNLGIPINSPLNDLYFIKSNPYSGFLTSSRKGSITEKDAPCCNDLYFFESKREPLENFQEIDKKFFSFLSQLPVTVYFHNDRPNPDSRDTTTNLNYEATYLKYMTLQEDYRTSFSASDKGEEAAATTEIDAFFQSYVHRGYHDLIRFADTLIQELDGGRSVQVNVQGFASPLTNSPYNVNLSKRRIVSVINFFKEYKQGVLRKYLNKQDSALPDLVFYKNPFGEFRSGKGVSDDYYDVRNSIYNPAAAKERKVVLSARVVDQDRSTVISLFLNTKKHRFKKSIMDQDSAHLWVHNDSNEQVEIDSLLFNEQSLSGSFVLDAGELKRLNLKSKLWHETLNSAGTETQLKFIFFGEKFGGKTRKEFLMQVN